MGGIEVLDPANLVEKRNERRSVFREVDQLSSRLSKKNLDDYQTKSSQRIGNVTSGISAYTGVWSDWEKLHLLRRTGFGVNKAHLTQLAGKTMSEAVDLVLTADPVMPAQPVNWYQPLIPDENGLAYGSPWPRNAINSYSTGVITNVYRSEGLKMWLCHQALNQNISIREKMVQFWYHFIPVNFDEILESNNLYCASNSARTCYDYMHLFRTNATGNYKYLIRQVATHPAMMYYLNNQANSSTAPDENFAREVMELFTIGNNLGTTYTQEDVVQAAKLLSGWRVLNLNTTNPSTTFIPLLHDYSVKRFSAFYNNTQIAGTGAAELDAFVNMIFARNTIVAQHLCRRLYRFFVYYDIDENVEANVIVPLAQVLIQNNWEVLPVLRVLFKSAHFFDVANRGVMIKSPFDFVIGNLREFEIKYNIDDPTNHYAQYNLLYVINEEALRQVGQVMGEVPNVSGWSAFYQKPNYYQYWINSNTLQRRYLLIQTLFYGLNFSVNGANLVLMYDLLQYVSHFPNEICRDPNLLVQEVVKYLFPVNLSSEQREEIKRINLLSGQTDDQYWTTAWNNYKNNPTTNNITIARNRVRDLFVHLMQLAEFHLT